MLSTPMGRRQRITILRVLMVLTLSFSFIFAAVNFSRGLIPVAVIQAIMGIFSTWLFFHIVRTRYPERWSLTYLVLFFAMMVLVLTTPDLTRTAFVWIMIIPAIAHFIHGRHLGLLLSGGFMLVAWVLYYHYHDGGASVMDTIAVANVVGASIVLMGMIYVYEHTRETTERDLQRLASTDNLTGLANRHHLQQLLKQTYHRSRRSQQRFSVLCLDLDWFKDINDRHGHDVGDQVLSAVANLLTERLRGSDVPSRWGGEEFLVLLPDTHRRGAESIGEEIRARLAAEPMVVAGHAVSVTCSIGVAEYPSDASSVAELLVVADRRLYRAKAEGRNTVVSDGESMPTEDQPDSSLRSA